GSRRYRQRACRRQAAAGRRRLAAGARPPPGRRRVILDEILSAKSVEVARRRDVRPLALLEASLADAPPHRPVASTLRAPGLSVIAEIKRRSPSGGELRPGASAADLARTYAEHGAAALSVLTDTPYFGGTDQDLVDARSAAALPALRKDF